MFKRISQVLCVYAAVAFMTAAPLISSILHTDETIELVQPTVIEEVVETVEVPARVYVSEQPKQKAMVIEKVEAFKEIVAEESKVSDEEIELLALLTMAEAEGESEEGQRLVIDTVLNRVDSDLKYFPDTITEVIYQEGQFTSMWNGRVDRCHVSEELCQLVREELESRTNNDVLYFRANDYSKYGTPLFVKGGHYFSTI